MLRKKILESSNNRRSARDRRNVEKKKTYMSIELSTGLKMPNFFLCALKLSEVAISSSTG